MIAGWAGAVGADADRARVRAVLAGAGGAFVVVHTALGGVLSMKVTVVQVVDMVAVQDGRVPATGAVRVLVTFGLAVLGGRHVNAPFE